MMRMGGVLGHDELNGEKIHRLENVMTLRQDLHWLFDTLGLWLEATVGLYCSLFCRCIPEFN
jgi:hypothetical protein